MISLDWPSAVSLKSMKKSFSLSLLLRLCLSDCLLICSYEMFERPLFYSMCATCQMKVFHRIVTKERKERRKLLHCSFSCLVLSFRVSSSVYVTRLVSSIVRFVFFFFFFYVSLIKLDQNRHLSVSRQGCIAVHCSFAPCSCRSLQRRSSIEKMNFASVLKSLLIARLISALLNPIDDCDEVFNFL